VHGFGSAYAKRWFILLGGLWALLPAVYSFAFMMFARRGH